MTSFCIRHCRTAGRSCWSWCRIGACPCSCAWRGFLHWRTMCRIGSNGIVSLRWRRCWSVTSVRRQESCWMQSCAGLQNIQSSSGGQEHGWRTGLRCAGECWICFGNLRCSIRFGQRISRCIAGVCMKRAVPLIWIRNCSGQRCQRNGKQSMSRFWSISCLLIFVVPSTMEM